MFEDDTGIEAPALQEVDDDRYILELHQQCSDLKLSTRIRQAPETTCVRSSPRRGD